VNGIRGFTVIMAFTVFSLIVTHIFCPYKKIVYLNPVHFASFTIRFSRKGQSFLELFMVFWKNIFLISWYVIIFITNLLSIMAAGISP